VRAGCGAAWQRASFGTKRPPVQIRPPRPLKPQVTCLPVICGLVFTVSDVRFWEPNGGESEEDGMPASLRAAISGPTPAQTEFAHRIGLELDPSTPRAVATALMLCRLREPIGLPVSGEPKERQLEYLHGLAEETGSLDASGFDGPNSCGCVDCCHAQQACRHGISEHCVHVLPFLFLATSEYDQ
jgi:hypothetical protein